VNGREGTVKGMLAAMSLHDAETPAPGHADIFRSSRQRQNAPALGPTILWKVRFEWQLGKKPAFCFLHPVATSPTSYARRVGLSWRKGAVGRCRVKGG